MNIKGLRTAFGGIPWQSSGWDSTLSLQGARVQSLIQELRSHMLCSAALKKRTAFGKLTNLLNTYAKTPVLDLDAKLKNDINVVHYAIILILFTYLFLSKLYICLIKIDVCGLKRKPESLSLLFPIPEFCP